jgi:hypothetical protein
MLFPEKWGEINGFFEAMTLPNVFPRYFHFITASMAITGLFLPGGLEENNLKQRVFSTAFQKNG